MTRCFFLYTSLLILFCSCNSSSNKINGKGNEKDSTTTSVANTAINLLGSYVGAFGSNKIALLITRIAGDTIEGRSVVGGNDRPYSGIVKFINDQYIVNAAEPGDDKDDGVFNFTIDTKQPDMVTGNWKPNAAGAHLGSKDFSLKRRAFNYLVDVGQYPQGSKRLLTEDDVNNLAKEDLEIMRNEIFARHGYCFRKKNLREMFEDKDWYIPNTIDIKNSLTDIEKKNITLIKRFEKYAVEYGDDYGR
jgi:hypothetical protein